MELILLKKQEKEGYADRDNCIFIALVDQQQKDIGK